MSSLSKEELEILTQEQIAHFVNSIYLKNRLSIFVKENNLTSTNYIERLMENKSALLRILEKMMKSFVEDNIIEKTTLTKTIHLNYDKIESWLNRLFEKQGISDYSITAKQHWDYCITTLVDLIGIRIIENILEIE